MRNKHRILAPGLVLFGAFLLATQSVGQSKKRGLEKDLRSPSSFAAIKDEKARSIALFVEASKVFKHPRCINCHATSDRPRRGDRQRTHRPKVKGGKEGKGVGAVKCAVCHGPAGLKRPGVPVVEGWRLAPAGAGWRGKTPGQICRQVRNKNSNGGMDMPTLLHHLAKDKLIAWSWNPGAKRSPAPGTQALFVGLMKAWAGSGAHCPQ